jgi:hypothetical protein
MVIAEKGDGIHGGDAYPKQMRPNQLIVLR